MAKYIDEAFWWDSLAQPDWYILLSDDFDRLEKLAKDHQDDPNRKEIKREAYAIVEKAIRENHIPLASSGYNFDQERQSVDTVVVHHTKNEPGMSLERLNAMHLIRLYGSRYNLLTDDPEQDLRGKPIWSGHFYQDQQVFWGYHWLIREDGTSQQILDDKYIGWHAGNWDINTRSIGICIDDDLSDKEPSEKTIEQIASIIKKNYLGANIVGHCDVNQKTECPGKLFHQSWLQKLLDMMS